MSNQNNDTPIDVVNEKDADNNSLNGLFAKLQKTYTISLPVWVYGLAALIAVVLIFD